MRDRVNEQAHPRVRSKGRWILPIVLLLAAGGAHGASGPARPECELGITLALNGRVSSAESVFVSLLTHFPGDAAAFVNLGNLRLLAGDPELALSFYQRGRAADSSDAGIVLNEATALLMLGDDVEAEKHARRGLQMAGGARAGASLLGLHMEGRTDASRGDEGARLGREELMAMLRAASGRVPADTARGARPDSTGTAPSHKKGPVWRAAGPRADESQAVPTLVYWKR